MEYKNNQTNTKTINNTNKHQTTNNKKMLTFTLGVITGAVITTVGLVVSIIWSVYKTVTTTVTNNTKTTITTNSATKSSTNNSATTEPELKTLNDKLKYYGLVEDTERSMVIDFWLN